MIKRIFDLTVVMLLSPVCVPLSLLIGLILLFARKGPVLYRSRRIGRYGKFFEMLKFRTMTVNKVLCAEQKYIFERDFKLMYDPRVTFIGKWLRRTSLDELPQLINVIKGEMAIVGPRPKLPEEIDLYREDKEKLVSVLPGITGYWQVFRTSTVSDAVMREMDLYYIRNQSLIFDSWLLLLTPCAIFAFRNC